MTADFFFLVGSAYDIFEDKSARLMVGVTMSAGPKNYSFNPRYTCKYVLLGLIKMNYSTCYVRGWKLGSADISPDLVGSA